MNKEKIKQIGRRKAWKATPSEIDQWLKTVHSLRGSRGVCKKGLYKFRTFEEAHQWMETMILSSIRESQQ